MFLQRVEHQRETVWKRREPCLGAERDSSLAGSRLPRPATSTQPGQSEQEFAIFYLLAISSKFPSAQFPRHGTFSLAFQPCIWGRVCDLLFRSPMMSVSCQSYALIVAENYWGVIMGIKKVV